MDHLWSPWRYKYVSTADSLLSGEGSCLFCRVASSSDDAGNLIVLRAERSFILLNRYPYSTGHLMIAPYQHVATLQEAGTESLLEMMRLAQRAETALRAIYQPEGMNFGFNIGRCAGAGIAGHIHMHGLPRWVGDTSFITTVGETRVLPEDLSATYLKLFAALKNDRS